MRVSVPLPLGLPALRLTPYSAVAIALGAALVLQLLLTVSLIPAAAHPRRRHALLACATAAGAACVMLCINLYTSRLWWAAPALFLLADAAYAQASVAYTAFLPPLTACSSTRSMTTREQEAARVRASGSVSHAAAGLGNLGGFAAALAGYAVLALAAHASGSAADPTAAALDAFDPASAVALRAALCVAGLWWAVWAFPGCLYLHRFPPPSSSTTTQPCFSGWHHLWALLRPPPPPLTTPSLAPHPPTPRLRHAGWILATTLLASLGATLLLQSTLLHGLHHLCTPPAHLALAAALAALGATLTAPLLPLLPALLPRLSRPAALAHLLTAAALVACYPLLGLASASVGLRRRWEVPALAAAQGAAAGAVPPLLRALLLDCVPAHAPAAATAAALHALARAGGAWAAWLVLAACLGGGALPPAQFRYTFVFAAVALLVAAVLVLVTVDQRQGMLDAGHIVERCGGGAVDDDGGGARRSSGRRAPGGSRGGGTGGGGAASRWMRAAAAAGFAAPCDLLDRDDVRGLSSSSSSIPPPPAPALPAPPPPAPAPPPALPPIVLLMPRHSAQQQQQYAHPPSAAAAAAQAAVGLPLLSGLTSLTGRPSFG